MFASPSSHRRGAKCPRAARSIAVAAALSTWLLFAAGCSDADRRSKADVASDTLSIAMFDVAEQAWGDAPLAVHFVWRVDGPRARPLRCKLDFEGDGAFDLEIADCSSDSMSTMPAKLPMHTYVEPGEVIAKLSVSDGMSTVEATTKLFANQVVFGPHVVFPEKLPGFLSAVQNDSGVTLSFQPGMVPTLGVDSILWGISEGGYLLRVREVTSAGDSLTIVGPHAAMEEAIERGFIGARDVPLQFVQPRCSVTSDCAGYTIEPSHEEGAKGPGEKRLAPPSRSASVGAKLKRGEEGRWEFSLFVGVEISELRFRFAGFALQEAAFVVSPKVEAELAAYVPLMVATDPRRTYFRLGAFSIGPLAGVVLLAPTLQVQTNVKFGTVLQVKTPYSAAFDGREWHGRVAPESDFRLVDWPKGEMTASASATFTPRLEVLFFGRAGPFVAPVLGVAAEAKISRASVPGCWTIPQTCFAPKGTLGGRFGLVAHLRTWDMLDREIEFASVDLFAPWCLPDAPMCEDAGSDASSPPQSGGFDGGADSTTSLPDARVASDDCVDEPEVCLDLESPRAPVCGEPSCITTRGHVGASTGDPHLRTFDGLRYDMQAVGEFVLARSGDDLEVQIRTRPFGQSASVSVNTAVAIRVGRQHLSIAAGRAEPLWIGGQPLLLPAGAHPLGEGAVIYTRRTTWKVAWSDGSVLTVLHRGDHLDVELALTALRKGTASGLLGNFDDDTTGELRTRSGASLPFPPSASQFYGEYVDSWRLAQAESLFDYALGESTDTFTDRSFPTAVVSSASLDAEDRARAEAVCRSAGISSPDVWEACLVDVGFTRDASYAEALRHATASRATLTLAPGPRAPASACECTDSSLCSTGGTRVVLTPTVPEVQTSTTIEPTPLNTQDYEKFEVDVSAFAGGGVLVIVGELGPAPGTSGSFDLFPACVPFPTGPSLTGALTGRHDVSAGGTFSLRHRFEAGAKLFLFGAEGNWFSSGLPNNSVKLTFRAEPHI